jgi:hypothetical protein
MATHTQWRRAGQAFDGLGLTEVTVLDGTEHGIQLIELQLLNVHLAQEIGRKSMELLGSFHQPLQHRVRSHLKDPGGGANAKPLGQARQDADNQLHRDLFAMKKRAMMFRKIALARGALELSPGATTGMTVGPQVAQPAPATIVTTAVGTKVHGRVHRPGAVVRGRHEIGSSRRRWSRLAGLLFTQGTVGLVRQALECFGLGGTLALGRDGLGWCLGRSTG